MGRRVPRALALAAVALSCGVAVPAPDGLGARLVWAEAPLDPALRVSKASVVLGLATPGTRAGERVLDVEFVPGPRALPRDRRAFYAALRASGAREVRLEVADGGERRLTSVLVTVETGFSRLVRAWPLAVIAGAFLLFGLALALGSVHPCAPPLCAVSWCIGAAALGELDRLVPELPSVLRTREAGGRLGVLAWTLLPAAILHLAMRFPVVSERFQSARAVALPYSVWLPPAVAGQLRFHDAAFQASLERIALGATLGAATLLAVASATAARRMRPIERARTGALIAGLGAGGVGPVLLAAAPGRAAPSLALTLLALPGALAWAIVRYHLLDPTARFQRAVLGSTTSLAALLLSGGGISVALSLAGVAGAPELRWVAPVGLLVAGSTQLLQQLLRRLASRRMPTARANARLLERAVRELARRTEPREVLDRAIGLAREGLAGASVAAVVVPDGVDARHCPLAASGASLWRRAGMPAEGIVRARGRTEDPSPDRAELVAALGFMRGARALLVAGGRPSGLPYTDVEQQLLEGLCFVSATALAAAATAADLESRVREKTAELGRGLRDRQRVLETAQGICAAEAPEEVLSRLAGFVEPADAGAARLSEQRSRELAPQLDTLRAFAGLALARLDLLAELKREVERQAAELGEARSKRLHAEFVRGVAHELRKPLAELRRRIEALEGVPRASSLGRVRELGRELDRRLDLLLFHSGIRLDRRRTDLTRLVDEAVAAARAVSAERDFWVFHEPPLLPILGDPGRLLSVIENLLDNAVKATRPGQRITLRSRLERGSPRGPHAVVEVEDEGSGIEPERAARVFEPGVAYTPGGFGLGLSLCREIVRLHGGTIELESRPGLTVFRLRIPVFAGDPEREAP